MVLPFPGRETVKDGYAVLPLKSTGIRKTRVIRTELGQGLPPFTTGPPAYRYGYGIVSLSLDLTANPSISNAVNRMKFQPGDTANTRV